MSHVCESPDLPAGRVCRYAGEAMAEPVLAQFGWVDDRALRGPSTQMRWAREMAITLLRRESPGDAPGRPFPSCMRTLPVHVVHKRLRRVRSHHPHWPRIRILRRNLDRWHIIVCVPIPNTGIHCSPQPMEKSPTGNRLLYLSLQMGNRMDPPGVGTESLAIPSSPVSTDDDSARGRTGRAI